MGVNIGIEIKYEGREGRASGKTTRAILDAVSLCSAGSNILFVTHDQNMSKTMRRRSRRVSKLMNFMNIPFKVVAPAVFKLVKSV